MTSLQIDNALEHAVYHRKPSRRTIFHSDRGSQYAGNELGKAFARRDITLSMGSTSSFLYNAITESFTHTLKTEFTYHTKFATRSDAHLELFDYIEIFYNQQRRHSSVNNMLPVSFSKSFKKY